MLQLSILLEDCIIGECASNELQILAIIGIILILLIGAGSQIKK